MLERVLHFKTVDSPIGRLRLMASHKGLCGILFNDGKDNNLTLEDAAQADEHNAFLVKAQAQLDEYFRNKRKSFDVKLDVRGTIFQQKAWKELVKIPFGSTISYSEQAKRMGDPKKARAVGMANGRNPLPIIVPCHRVIGESGHLTGYAGGLNIKEYLLNHEGIAAAVAS
jgi:methylated-DNA-[protein]-cysteine S-methyltransferase